MSFEFIFNFNFLNCTSQTLYSRELESKKSSAVDIGKKFRIILD